MNPFLCCKECEGERSEKCHSTCEKHKKAVEIHQKQTDFIKKHNKKLSKFEDVVIGPKAHSKSIRRKSKNS